MSDLAAQPEPDPAALEDEARFVARLTLDLCIAQFHANGGVARPNVPATVTQVIGTLQEARRQLAAVRAGETVIVGKPAPAGEAAA